MTYTQTETNSGAVAGICDCGWQSAPVLPLRPTGRGSVAKNIDFAAEARMVARSQWARHKCTTGER